MKQRVLSLNDMWEVYGFLVKLEKRKFAFVAGFLGVFLMGLFIGVYAVPWLKSIYKISEAKLENLVIEFLKTTDVPSGGWDNTVEIMKIYDHEFGGKVVVVKYTTASAGHPAFFLEAIEHHIAVITFNMRGEVVSAFCIWGSFHDGKTWDLLNQRWIQE